MASHPQSLTGNATGATGSGSGADARESPAASSSNVMATVAPPRAAAAGSPSAKSSCAKAPPIQRPPLNAAASGKSDLPGVEPVEEEASLAELTWTARFERFWKQASSCLASLTLHAALIVLLGLWAARSEDGAGLPSLLATSAGESESLVSSLQERQAEVTLLSESVAGSSLSETADELASQIKAAVSSVQPKSNDAPPTTQSETGIAVPVGGGNLFNAYDADAVGSLGGRGKAERAKLVADDGGTPQSEQAVAHGLRWLQAHQNSDGSWHFDLKQCPCDGLCRDSGHEASTPAATAMALLAFLGNGQTQREGEYQETVRKGLYYLCSRMEVTKHGGSFIGNGDKGMYAHGLASIAICEAYAMTKEPSLKSYAQETINFIVYAQDQKGGGWRYHPGMPGDTSVVGWQLMALKSGQMAFLSVPQDTIYRAIRFLDSVEFNHGAQYQYQPRSKDGKELTMTSVGLLCRLYTGWALEHPGMEQGVKLLARQGPSRDNMYYNYYATQVMHQWGGAEWREWNYMMRDYLVRTQSHEGHESGSWHFNGSWATPGGRLYNTTLAIMTLEVYYRHLPLYRPRGFNVSN